MNWNRKELKKNGKAAMKRCYWPCVLTAFVLFIIAYVETKEAGNSGNGILLSGALGGAALGSAVLAVLIQIVIRNMLQVGGARFFINNCRNPEGNLMDMFEPYSEGNNVKIFTAMFLKDLFIALWTLLLIVPGIIKSYSYRMVPDVLADHPGIEPMEALRRSEEMMKGQKWKAFVLDLSFIGWEILDIFTFGILGILYVHPYKEAADAELYNVLCA